jgi:hypothetical protein
MDDEGQSVGERVDRGRDTQRSALRSGERRREGECESGDKVAHP